MKQFISTTALALIVATSCVAMSAIQASERNSKSDKKSEEQTPVTYPLEGIWEQRFAYKGKWTGVLKAEVKHVGNSYRMVVLEQLSDSALTGSLGISNVNHIIDTWTFDSNWGAFGTGNFVLKRQTDDRYVGHAYQDGQQRGVNEWVRIAKPVAGERTTQNDESIKIHESETSWLIIGKWKNPTANRKATGFRYGSRVLTLHFAPADQRGGPHSTPLAHWEIPKREVPDLAAARIELHADTPR